MSLRQLNVALALVLAACGGAPPPVQSAEPLVETDDDGAPPRRPLLMWDEGDERVTVAGVGVVFRVRAPITRLAPDEVATEQCGDRMLHAMVVDRRISPSVDEILGRAFLRAGCSVPEEGRIVGSWGGSARERTLVVHFDGGEMDGDWELRALVLDRAHRSLAIVSAQRVLPLEETQPLFTIEEDTPGLEAMAVGLSQETTTVGAGPSQATRTMEVVLGAARVVGEVLSIFR